MKMTMKSLVEAAGRCEREAACLPESGGLLEELELVERSMPGKAAVISSAIDALKSAIASSYSMLSAAEVSGIVNHHVGRAMKEARAMNDKK